MNLAVVVVCGMLLWCFGLPVVVNNIANKMPLHGGYDAFSKKNEESHVSMYNSTAAVFTAIIIIIIIQ
jgi:hypothetical protein